ncbi:hypothetical protein DV738_g1482, partial [Chaetothyriales sp. CBS 135597]
MAANLPSLPDVERLSTNIVRVLGGNPSKYTLQGSNTYILGAGPQRILLDTGQGFPAWKENLSKALEQYHTSISLYNLIDPSTTLDISDGQKFSTAEGFELTALHTPGHAADHMCFLVTASSDPSELGSIFTADNVLGHGTAVFEDLDAYTVKAYPGHGQVIDDAAGKIQEYLEHRRQREEEVLNLLRHGTTTAAAATAPTTGAQDATADSPPKEWGSMELVKVIYQHYPESLHVPAEGGVKQVLGKLLKEGRVVYNEQTSKWRIAGTRATL